MEAEERAKQRKKEAPTQSQPAEKKVKITWEEYQKLSIMICDIIKNNTDEDNDSMVQGEIVNRIAQKIVTEEGSAQSVEKMAETAKKIHNCITHLITKENVLMITQDSKNKNERMLCMSINADTDQLKGQ